jgi:hypothetical protein
MGPITLFDKSFLQSLSVDESVWFGQFFMPVIAPLFYVETLADLEKAVRERRTPEQEVGIIAMKFPELSAVPTMYHGTLAINELLGVAIDLSRRPIRPGGRVVTHEGQRGIVYDESPEADAFSRWQKGKFLELERGMAKDWRAALKAMNLPQMAKSLRELGITGSTCGSLSEARDLARTLVTASENPMTRVALTLDALGVPLDLRQPITERWMNAGFPPLSLYAPYSAHLLTVEMFFQYSLAANLISADRASNRVDIAYLNYLPFSQIFVSSDKLHRKAAPLFMRSDQEFVWGPELKNDLHRINDYFLALPDSEKERGIMSFAHAPPKLDGSLVRELRSRYMRKGYDDEPPIDPKAADPAKMKALAEHLASWAKAPEEPPAPPTEGVPFGGAETKMMAIERRVRLKKGSWWQLPKDIKDKS